MNKTQEQALRKLIREQIENLIDSDLIIDANFHFQLERDLFYLKDFNFKEFKEKDGKNIWKYSFLSNSKEYQINFYVIEFDGKWMCKMYIYWINKTDDYAPNAGKDAEQQYGTFSSYKEMVEQCNLKLKNNLLVSPKNYHDNWELNMDMEAVILLKKLQKLGTKLEQVNHNSEFNDLINIYHQIKNFKSDKEFLDFSQKEAPKEEDKQTFILDLQKMNKHGFYQDMKKMHGKF